MDRRQKSTLRSLHIRIADELILDEDFYAALRRDKIFTNGMLDLIKAEVKPRDRVYKMLELLEKRGPKAFENFVWILKENYEWLAKDLEEQYTRRLQRSVQERENPGQTSNQYETEPKYSYNDQYQNNSHSQFSKNRAVSTPTPMQRTSKQANIPTQESVSAGFYSKDSQHYFDNDTTAVQQLQQQRYQQTNYDSTDNLNITLPAANDTDVQPQRKQYKDACMSPIGIIQSSRRDTQHHKEEALSEADSYDQGFDEIESETATTVTLTNDDVESQVTSTTEVQSEDFETVSENADVVDAAMHIGIDQTVDDLMPSEVYYDNVRSSSQFSHFDDEVFQQEFSIPDDDNDAIRSELSFDQTEAFQFHMEEMRTFYMKLKTASPENDDMDGTDFDTISWDLINYETDKLINRLENSDDMKMIRKCYELFEEKERRQPLNLCIESLFTEKKDFENRLREKKREMDQMVFDLWKHQQDMSNIKKLRKTLAEKESENSNLKTSLENLEKDADIKLRQIGEKDTKIQDLESRMQELQCEYQRKPGVSTRRGLSNQRRVSNVQGQSPRRQTNYYQPEPRISLMHGAYSQQSPRNVATAMRRAPSNRK